MTTRAASLCAAMALAACAGLPTARMALPPALAQDPGQTLPVPFGRTGQFELPAALGGGRVRFERSADRLSFFDTADFDRASLTVRLEIAGLPASEHACRLRRTGIQAAGVAVDLQPARLVCEGAGATLELQARPGAARSGRNGSATIAGQTLQIQSVHRIQGAPLAQEEPVGYLLLDQGRPVAALDLLGTRPVLRVVEGAPAPRQAAIEAALLLALVWDPAR